VADDPNRICNRRKKVNHMFQQRTIAKLESGLVPSHPAAFSAGQAEAAQSWNV